MTLIVNPKVFTSKAALKAALDQGRVEVWEPSVMGEWVKAARDLPIGFRGVVVNHPKRTKFAEIARGEKGWTVR